MTPLHQKILALRPKIAAAAQRVLDNWHQDESGVCDVRGEGGACDDVSRAITDVLASAIPSLDFTDGGQPGDDHAYPIAYTDKEAFAVDIPAHIYEIGGGYRWKKRDGVRLKPEHVVVDVLRRSDIAPEDDGYAKGRARAQRRRAGGRSAGMTNERRPKVMYFLRDTQDPKRDLARGFSCNVNAWFSTLHDATEYAADHGALAAPKFDRHSGQWCADPEQGLSSFAFHDEATFKKAMRRVSEYTTGRRVAVFESASFLLSAGLDGEDVFRDGRFVGWITLNATYEEFVDGIVRARKQA